MIAKLSCSLLAAIALALPAAAQNLKSVEWSVAEAPKAMKPGARFKVKLVAQIAEGWHLYSTTQAEGGPIPTRITLPDGQPFKAAGPLKGSRPKAEFDDNFSMKVEYHEGEAEFIIPVQAAPDASAGTQKLAIHASFQACSDKLCLPPRTAKLETGIEIR